MSRRPSVSFIAWSPIGGRSEEIADALGGEARCFYRRGRFGKLSVLGRYGWSAVATLRYLRVRRPRTVIATNPPIFPALLAFAYARARGARLALDSHPGGFGLQGDRVSRLLQPLHAWLARRAATTLVTDDRLARRVGGWGGRADIVHEAPVDWRGQPRRALRPRPRVLFVCIFQRDEPVAEVLEAARRCPELDIHVTGDPAKCPSKLRDGAPPNVRFVGFLTGEDYERAVLDADVVLALTTEPSSVVRAGYEAVYAERPLVVSDWPAAREVFPHAVRAANDAPGVAAGLRRAVSEHERLVRLAPEALELQRARWDEQLAGLRARLSTETPTPTPTPSGA
jgi:glycosyltransferase involved in cell wall biosynthesis